ncbi:MAG: hypothetical protein K8T90_22395 [Planctomycetes bacterium]|nr:hypothetical protein [Planctomycetota bacterium]
MNRSNLSLVRGARGDAIRFSIRSASAAAVLAAGVLTLSLAGCACPGTNPASVDKAGSIVKKDSGYYAVDAHDGRTYVFGDEDTHAAWQKSHAMQYSKSMIGAGPKGETVVFEVRDKLPELQERLMTRFASENGMKQ